MKNTIFKKYNVIGDDLYYHHTESEPTRESYYLGPETHLQYEVLYLLSGEVSYIIEGESYDVRRGDMIFVAPKEIHTLKVEGNMPYERAVLLFNMDILHRLMRELEVKLGIFGKNEENPFHIIKSDKVKEYGLDRIMMSIIEEEGEENRKKLNIMSKLIRFIVSIDRARAENTSPEPASRDKLVLDVAKYVNSHIHEPIRLEDIAKELFISVSTLCHSFSSLMNMTVNKYVITKKIHLANDFLHKGYSARAAAEAVGYDNYTSFFYNYKGVMGTPPTAYDKS